jgi:hypothetical protein
LPQPQELACFKGRKFFAMVSQYIFEPVAETPSFVVRQTEGTAAEVVNPVMRINSRLWSSLRVA